MNKKTNPRHRPVSQADVDKAFERGKSAGIDTMLAVMLYVLRDKHDATAEELKTFWKEFLYQIDSIDKGYVSIKDILDVLEEEYDITLEIT